MFILTKEGKRKVNLYIAELKRQKEDILAAGKDTADETELPTEAVIVSDIEYWIDKDGEYYNGWGITDNYNSEYALALNYGTDFVKNKEVN